MKYHTNVRKNHLVITKLPENKMKNVIFSHFKQFLVHFEWF